MLYRALLAIDLAAAAVALFFFLWGLSDGTVSSFNAADWALLLGGIAAVLVGGVAANGAGWPRLAKLILALLAVPSAALALFFGLLIISQPRWN